MRSKKDQDPFITWRLKFSTVFSAIILLAVCSLELIDVPFKNEGWFGFLVIAALLGCLLLMSWSFGMFDKEK